MPGSTRAGDLLTGRYRLVDLLSEARGGRFWRAWDTVLSRAVAVHLIPEGDDLKTLPQGLTTFMGEYTTDWGMLFAGLTIAAAPITLLYIALSRQFIQGMTAGAVK